MKKIFYITICILLIFAIPTAVFAAETGNQETIELISKKFEEWILPHLEEISVIITLILTAIYNFKRTKLLNQSMGTMNNNAVAIAEQNSNIMSKALINMENTSGAVLAYDTKIAQMLEAYQYAEEDKKRLEHELTEIKSYLKTATEANLEFSNELAELLNLANIPNFKKEEIGARHLAAVNAIKAVETEMITIPNETPEEVLEYDGKEA